MEKKFAVGLPADLRSRIEGCSDLAQLTRWFDAALDAKSSQERAWQTGWSVRAGIEFQPNSTGAEARRRLSVQLQAYDGPAPYGQFYLESVKSVGLGLHFSL